MSANMLGQHRVNNSIQTQLLFSGMVLLLSIIGDLLFGIGSLNWIVLILIMALYLLTNTHPAMMMGLHNAQPISLHQGEQLHQTLEELYHRAKLVYKP